MSLRTLVVVLGDQLDEQSAAFDGFDPACDAVWLCECPAEARYAWSHQARIALFLSAMRHFTASLRARGCTVHHLRTGEHPYATLAEALRATLVALTPQRVVLCQPGEWRLAQDFAALADDSGIVFEIRQDRHFWLPLAEFQRWMQGRRQPRLEHFYRWMRQRTGVLMDGDEPAGGQWNFDHDNRASFGAQGPGRVPPRLRFRPDAITREVIATVQQHYPEHPGRLDTFDWPVTRDEALEALDDFIEQRLPCFGQHQDAMWKQQPWLWHSHIAAALNLKLLKPQEVCARAEAAWKTGQAPLASVEGFVRQILGWREYVRGLYWQHMPQYLADNALNAQAPLPAFYWTASTDMACLAEVIGQTLATGYAHHIQRLMVTGLFALLLGVDPQQVHGWYLAVYVDAVEWVELPNTIGMSQFADGGLMGSKPYIASGQYIQRMSNYCAGCRYDPRQATGPRACPFTTLYWDFLGRHAQRFAAHPRLKPQVNNWLRKSADEQAAIGAEARLLKARLAR
jgi:deoxyribodipyrimidine photolyase-related protein